MKCCLLFAEVKCEGKVVTYFESHKYATRVQALKSLEYARKNSWARKVMNQMLKKYTHVSFDIYVQEDEG